MMKPGTSAILMRDIVGNLQAALSGLKGASGTVLKSNVDLDRAWLLQRTLQAKSVKQ